MRKIKIVRRCLCYLGLTSRLLLSCDDGAGSAAVSQPAPKKIRKELIMDNLEYLLKCRDKDGNIDYREPNLYEEIGFHEREFRKMRALEIIAETLINIKNRMESEQGINVDVTMSQ